LVASGYPPSGAGEHAPVIRGKAAAALDTRASHDPPPGEEAICGSPWDKTPAAQEFPAFVIIGNDPLWVLSCRLSAFFWCSAARLSANRKDQLGNFMRLDSDIVRLEAVPAAIGDGWRVFIEWVSGRIQYINGFETLPDAENWIETSARNWISSSRNQL
jgi:hypothetical protein